MKCKECDCEIINYERYVKLPDGMILDEKCFFDLALERLNAINIQHTTGQYRIVKRTE